MKVAYIGQPYDRFFPPVQNSIGLIVFYTALELSRRVTMTIYGRYFRDDEIPEGIPFRVRRMSAILDRLQQKAVQQFPRIGRIFGLERRLDDHAQFRRQLRRSLRRDRPDVIHLMNYWNWCQELKGPEATQRLVLEMQCEWLSEHERSKVARQLQVVDAVVAVSDHIAKTFRYAFPDYAGLVATVGNGVDTDHFRPVEPFSNGKEERKILFVGRISPEKGIHTLLEAFAGVAERHRDVELLLAGPQAPLPAEFMKSLSSDPRVVALLRFYDSFGRCTYAKDLDKLIDRFRLRDRVQFLGSVSHKELVATYQAADVVVNPSLSESFGISVVEGMACGIPVVGTRIGGMCESISDGVTGVLVEADSPAELSSALLSVLDDPSRAHAMGKAGRTRAVTMYSWNARAARLIDVYERVTSGASQHRYGS